MAVGLLALLDDVAALVKVSAASLDDIPTQVAKTTSKVSGIVIDDAAVTPKYVVGLDPSRELSIIYQIAKKSLINKILFLTPVALLLGFFAPGLIQPVLMIGGGYLCFEGFEKIRSMFSKPLESHTPHPSDVEVITPDELEKIRVKGAVRTDFILSAEIMAITFSTVSDKDIMTQIIVLLSVAVVITIAVYGFVGLVVKADDVGLHLSQGNRHPVIIRLGRGIVRFMPHFLKVLGYVGTVAMLWVGAEIIAHGIPVLHHLVQNIEGYFIHMPLLAWGIKATFCALIGIVIGFLIELGIVLITKLYRKKSR